MPLLIRSDCPVLPGNVVPFRPLRPNAFTVRDRVEALQWQESGPAQASGLARLDIHAEHPGDGQETCDFLLLYRRDECWARWGAARRADRIDVWRCADGSDLGRFETMRQALDALLQADSPRSHQARGFRVGRHGAVRTA